MNRRQFGALAAAGLAQYPQLASAQGGVRSEGSPRRAPHVVLIGDSIFDNARYVAEGKSVTHHFQHQMPPGWNVTLRAVDGAVAGDVKSQLSNLPAGTTHIIMSVGGNDALRSSNLLEVSSTTVGDSLLRLAEATATFESRYRAALADVVARERPTMICTIYNPQFPDPKMQRAAIAGLALFNDCIIRAAVSQGVPVLDLRFICDAKEDFANPIEPSSRGGEKITAALIESIRRFEPATARTEIFK
jgi:hypothetical protein